MASLYDKIHIAIDTGSPWPKYAVGTALIFGSILLTALVWDIAVGVWNWCGFGPMPVEEAEVQSVIDSTEWQEQSGVRLSPEERIVMLEKKLDFLQRRVIALESRPPPTAPTTPNAAPPPPPPPPPLPISERDPLEALKQKTSIRRDEVIIKDNSSEPATMHEVLQELFKVQRKVVNFISPRKSYMQKRLITRQPSASSPLRKSSASTSATVAKPSKLSLTGNRRQTRSVTRAMEEAEAIAPGGRKPFAANDDRTMSSLVTTGASRTKPPDTTVRMDNHRWIDAETEVEDKENGSNKSMDSLMPPRDSEVVKDQTASVGEQHPRTLVPSTNKATGSMSSGGPKRLPSETLARDIAVMRLKPTGIPRSPGGTTLIPQRRPASKPPTATEEAFRSLKEKFKRAYPKDEDHDARIADSAESDEWTTNTHVSKSVDH
ncbi:hypothetical protein HDU85_000088 [Gaertneriomyces sp. JEL0708]|nr:hypothetical protein HDU85_000088 [Gaertneriomyces sp. JEL0708]